VAQLAGVYTSDDFGVTWIDRSAAGDAQGNPIYGRKYWRSIASSEDGSKLAAVAAEANGGVFTSDDFGVNWIDRSAAGGAGNPISGTKNWRSIASSDNGERLAAVVGHGVVGHGGGIYTSENSGETWAHQSSAGNRNWQSIASSSDGNKLAAAANGGWIVTGVAQESSP